MKLHSLILRIQCSLSSACSDSVSCKTSTRIMISGWVRGDIYVKPWFSSSEMISCLKSKCAGETCLLTWIAECTWAAPSIKSASSNKLLRLFYWNQKAWRKGLPSFLLHSPGGSWLPLLWIKLSLAPTLLEFINVSLVSQHKHVIKSELLRGRVCDYLGCCFPCVCLSSVALWMWRG